MVADPTSNQNVFIFMEFRKIDETPPFGGSGILDPSLLFQDATIALAVFDVHRPNAEQLELDHPMYAQYVSRNNVSSNVESIKELCNSIALLLY